jgi:hypothetical protein
MRVLLVLAATLLVTGSSLKAAPILSLEPAFQSVVSGATLEVQVRLSELRTQDAPSVGAIDLTLQFDPALLAPHGVSFGDPTLGDQLDLTGVGAISDYVNLAPGMLEVYEISLDSAAVLSAGQASQFILASLQWTSHGSGSTSIVPAIQSASDADGRQIQLTLQEARVEVTNVPEPSAALLVSLSISLIIVQVLRRQGS